MKMPELPRFGSQTMQPMQVMFRSAIFKLTAAYVIIIMTICILFSGVFYHLAFQELSNGFSNQYARWYNLYEPLGLRSPGSPATELSERAAHLYVSLVWLNVIVLILTTIICYFFAKRTLRPIEAAHEQQRRFTADVSHELRTPLTALKMDTEVSLLDPKTKPADLRNTLRGNLEEVQHMETLINNLLLISSMEANKLRTEFTQEDVENMVNTATRTVTRLAERKHIILTQHLQSQFVRCDSASLTQLFVILLENAIKYSPEGSKVSIRVGRKRGRVFVAVTDQGQGISAEALPHVFDRFYRADESRVRNGEIEKTQGYGLGLSLAKLIADLHDAEIVISSAPDAGTKASIILQS